MHPISVTVLGPHFVVDKKTGGVTDQVGVEDPNNLDLDGATI